MAFTVGVRWEAADTLTAFGEGKQNESLWLWRTAADPADAVTKHAATSAALPSVHLPEFAQAFLSRMQAGDRARAFRNLRAKAGQEDCVPDTTLRMSVLLLKFGRRSDTLLSPHVLLTSARKMSFGIKVAPHSEVPIQRGKAGRELHR